MKGFRAIAWWFLKQFVRFKFPDVPHISTQELHQWLQRRQSEPFLLLDARSPEEFAISHLPHARYAGEVFPERQNTEVERTEAIAVYCSIGYRSARLVQQLQAQGYQRVFNVEGSIFEWANEGNPVYRGDEEVPTVHPYNASWGWWLRRDKWAE